MPLNVATPTSSLRTPTFWMSRRLPPVLLDICAHVKGYQPIIKRWEAGDFSENSSVINFPRGRIEEFAFREFSWLKKEQGALLGRTT
jgi:hypothetical protein